MYYYDTTNELFMFYGVCIWHGDDLWCALHENILNFLTESLKLIIKINLKKLIKFLKVTN